MITFNAKVHALGLLDEDNASYLVHKDPIQREPLEKYSKSIDIINLNYLVTVEKTDKANTNCHPTLGSGN